MTKTDDDPFQRERGAYDPHVASRGCDWDPGRWFNAHLYDEGFVVVEVSHTGLAIPRMWLLRRADVLILAPDPAPPGWFPGELLARWTAYEVEFGAVQFAALCGWLLGLAGWPADDPCQPREQR